MRRDLGGALLASVVVHALLSAVAVWRLSGPAWSAKTPRLLPIGLKVAPDVPVPPVPPAEPPNPDPEKPKQKPKPKPKPVVAAKPPPPDPEKPKPDVAPKPKPKLAEVAQPSPPDAGPAADAGAAVAVAAEDAGSADAGAAVAVASEDAGSADAGIAVAAASEDAGAADAGAAVAVAAEDAGAVAATAGDAGPTADAGTVVAIAATDAGPRRIDPGVADLSGYVPAGEKLMLVVRGDRLRGSPWARSLDGILAPMPDYRFLFSDTGLTIADTFETLLIASPNPREVTETLVAGRTTVDEGTIRRALGKRGVTWSPVAGGTVGERSDPLKQKNHDPRVLFVPYSGWFLLARPEHLGDALTSGGHPPWLTAMAKVEEETGDALAVLVLAGISPNSLLLPGVYVAPVRVTIAVTADPDGLVVTGAALCRNEQEARAFLEQLTRARDSAMGSVAARFVLAQLSARGAVKRLRLAQHGDLVTFATSLTTDEAKQMLEQAAAWSRDYFLPPPPPP